MARFMSLIYSSHRKAHEHNLVKKVLGLLQKVLLN